MQHNITPEDHGPLGSEMADAVSTCVHCGFCLAACPTYNTQGRETESPRGRIILMKEVLEGTLELETAAPHLDSCLGCLACEPACPSGVSYRNLISPFRANTSGDRKRTFFERLQRLVVQQTLPYPSRFRLAALSGRLAKPFASLMPRGIGAMLELLPNRLPAKQSWQTAYPTTQPRRARVAMLTGCAQSVLNPDINTATIEVLNHFGVEVIVPKDQGCCGALNWHVGNIDAARRFARQNLEAFGESVDAIVTNAAGCGSGMQEYAEILKGTEDEQAAKRFSQRVCDVSQYLWNLGALPSIPAQPTSVVIAYHDACHLSNAQGVKTQPRRLLGSIPGVRLKEIHDSQYCCGSAGTYNIDQPEIAGQLGERKAGSIIDTGADIVASGNIGCLTQLETHLNRQGSTIRVLHTMQVLRDAIRGRSLGGN